MNQLQTAEKQRDSNFELLRITAMFLIVIGHLGQHGIWFAPNAEPSFNFLLSRFRLGWLGNFLFMLVSGYFMANTHFSWKKLFRMWLQIFSISACIGLFAFFSKIQVCSVWYDEASYVQNGFFATAHQVGIKELIRSCMPCYFGNNWFAVAYMVFYLFAPFANKLFNTLTEKEHRFLMILMIVLQTVVPFFPRQGIFFGDNLFAFLLCHCTADYIRRYNPKILTYKKLNITLSLLLIASFFCWFAFTHFVLVRKIPTLQNHILGIEGRWGGMNSFSGFLCAVLIFCVFKDFSVPCNKRVNTVASATFGVYLLHENLLINKWLWHIVFRMDNWLSSPWLLAYMILCASIVFAICDCIELLRQRLQKIGRASCRERV